MIEAIPKKNYQPSTITIVSKLTNELDVTNVAKFLPVINLFDKTGQRIKLLSGSRNSIQYYGIDKIIISVCYKKIRRGMRTGAMNNMVSIDIQILNKNIHVKLSSNSVTCVGTSGIEHGIEVFDVIKNYIYMLDSNIKYCRNYENSPKLLDWLFTACVEDETLIRLDKLNVIISNSSFSDEDKKFLHICSSYIDDFDTIEPYKIKIKDFLMCENLFDTNIEFQYPSVYNSVYHCTLSKNYRIPLHQLAPYLSNMGLIVEFHNWSSEGCNICFPIEEFKDGHITKEYKHRFTIHERSTMRQCSPTYHNESYKFYTIIVGLINKFIKENESNSINYQEYIRDEII